MTSRLISENKISGLESQGMAVTVNFEILSRTPLADDEPGIGIYIDIYKLYILCCLVLSYHYPPTVDVMPWRARPTQRHKTFGVRWPEPKCTKRCCKLWFLRFRSIYRINKLRELHQNWKIHKPKSLYCAPKLSASVQMPFKEKLKVKPPMPHPLIDHAQIKIIK